MPIIMLPNTNTHNLTQVTHRLIIVFVLLCTLIYNKQIMWLNILNFFSVEILLFWLPGRVAGPEVGPGRKWQGLGPALSVASAATDWKKCVFRWRLKVVWFANIRLNRASSAVASRSATGGVLASHAVPQTFRFFQEGVNAAAVWSTGETRPRRRTV